MSSDSTYELANPLAVLLGKSPREFQRADFVKVVEKKNIKRLHFHYTGLDGRLKELKLPVVNPKQLELLLSEGERVDGSSLFKGVVDPGCSDLYVVPEFKTAFLNPFDQGGLDFICRYMTKEGNLAPFAPDNILRNASRFFQERTGRKLHAMGELEFFLISSAEDNIYPLNIQTGYHESGPFIKSGPILNEILCLISRVTGAVKYVHSEVGSIDFIRSDMKEIQGKRAEQLEVEYSPSPVCEMGDALVIGRWLIRNVAYRHGCVATFIPKIEEGLAGNGLHFHLTLEKDNKNLLVDEKTKRLSEDALCLIGGLCQHAKVLTAFGNMSASSYLRLVPDQEAPTRVCWSDMNRNALIRVPLGWSDVKNLAAVINPQDNFSAGDNIVRQTVELRTPDGSALIHLILAGIIMATEWAFVNREKALVLSDKLYAEAGAFANKEKVKTFPSLPGSCVESSRILLENRQFFEREGIFPQAMIEFIAGILKNENDEVISQKLQQLPEDSRLHEFRKIMHRDLHKH
ncbi:MAG: glutamine synthetase [Candidatus Aminicenantes bacterium]|nr:glutamine synthetase [Candidatus Aminicenantes bacterium]